MEETAPLAEVLERYMRRAGLRPGALARRSDLPKPTIVNWLERRVRKPHTWEGLARVASALNLSTSEASELLQSAGHPSVAMLLLYAATNRERTLLSRWAADRPQAHEPTAASRRPRADLSGAVAAFEQRPQPAMSARSPLSSGSRVPLPRNPLFVGREGDLRALARVLAGSDPAAAGQPESVAVTAIGGIGKTQLAAEFVHRYGPLFTGGVFWLSFADAGLVPEEIAACGGAGFMALRRDFGALSLREQVELVQAAWSSSVQRLLVFDNCEDEELFARWRPTSGGSRVLITSRRSHWDLALGIRVLPLSVLDRAASIALLHQHLPEIDAASSDLDAIAEELGDLPLALHLAGSYLARYRHSVSPADYLAQMSPDHLLSHPSLGGNGVSPTRHVQHVGRTFALSLDRLDASARTDVHALTLLSRAAYFAPGEPIPRGLLLATCTRERPRQRDGIAATDALLRLASLGLADLSADGSVRVHRLVAAFARVRIVDADAPTAVEQTLIGVADASNAADDVAALQAVHRHLRYVANAALERSDAYAVQLCRALGHYLWRTNDFAAARHYFEQALAIGERSAGHDPLELAETLQSLALVLQAQSQLPRAHQLFAQSLDIWTETLGPQHLITSRGLTNLGFVLILEGEYDRATSFLKRALAIRRRASRLRHRETAHIVHCLGLVCLRWGAYRRAQRYLKLALEIRRQVLPAGHFALAQTLLFLGDAALGAGDACSAWHYHEQAFAIRQKLFGDDNPATAESMEGLGRVLHALGDTGRARAYLERAVAILSLRVGQENFLTAYPLRSLGVLLYEQGEYAASRRCLEQAVASWERAGGDDHPELAPLLCDLALVSHEQGAYAEARAYIERAGQIACAKLGKHHPATARSLCILRTILHSSASTASVLPVHDPADPRPLPLVR